MEPIQSSMCADDVLCVLQFVLYGNLFVSDNDWLCTRYDNKVRELATVWLPWQQWTETSVWFDDIGISAFHSCVYVDVWQSLSEWRLLLSECVSVCRHENAGAGIRALSVRE
jgi:hypothetical protein